MSSKRRQGKGSGLFPVCTLLLICRSDLLAVNADPELLKNLVNRVGNSKEGTSGK
jgi:hypothetical protein